MNLDAIDALKRPAGLPFRIGKIGHVALYVSDMERSARFYTQILGFEVTEAVAPGRLPGGAIFLRCNTDHHGIALFQATGANPPNAGLHHMALEVPTLDELVRFRDHLRAHQVPIDLDGRRGAGVQLVVEFRDPDGHRVEIYWGIDQIGSEGHVRPASEWKPVSSLEAAIADPVVGQDTTLADPALIQN
jgi:catechol 2,3-dioxygenase-like lactoylglutathione lyase family enzyme